MRTLFTAIAWTALLIGLPLFAHTGLISAARLAGIAPTLTVLAVLHLAAPRLRSCGLPRARSQSGAE